ncbi:U6 snRNA-associated Sm-like protein LSm7 [Suncus etruscus]|uniref:U6 snRNA-associated Sm-like protein LSm7 n=1 Tax=Suncus etruscus TaxID=109475 RepID=UPI00210F78A1|nr:U6 snRNA-associated Sm-like protein LSm7 [Suncus etruscus]
MSAAAVSRCFPATPLRAALRRRGAAGQRLAARAPARTGSRLRRTALQDGGERAAAAAGDSRRESRGRAPLSASRALLPPQDKEKKKKESILDLSKYIDKTIRVKFQGGREASGILKGFDPLLNLVLDGTIEYMRDPDDQYKLTEDTRQLGLVVCRGTSVVLICPQDGMEAIPNPFIQQQEA